MLDPVGGFQRIKDFFISYVETSFRIADPATQDDRRSLLLTPNALATDPFIEPVLRYESSSRALEQLLHDENILGPISHDGRVAFIELALSGLFDGTESPGSLLRRRSSYNPYLHQEQMLRRGIRPGRPGIVTSGTGSGKTESFMLPVFAQIANEAVKWPAPHADYLSSRWWRDTSRYVRRRAFEAPERPAAVRAIILYPMNALVEDQMVRLRKALDSDMAQDVMDVRFRGNRIFFGQYTSATPVTGFFRHPRRFADLNEQKRQRRRMRKLREAMRKMEARQAAARAHDAEASRAARERNETIPDATRFIFPSIDGGEMVSRWDMQAAPPDILVTNASMLGAMLSREVEEDIFEKTRLWLENDPNAYFFLIFDELHLVRGSAGTEIGYLVKSLLERLGLDDTDRMHKLRVLASSASLPLEGERGLQSVTYLRDLFAPYGTSQTAGDAGTVAAEFWRDCVITGLPVVPERSGGRLPAAPFRQLLESCDPQGRGFIASTDRKARLDAAIQSVGRALGVDTDRSQRLVASVAERAAEVLVSACRADGVVRATSVADIASRAFLDGEGDAHATRGLLLARALPDCPGIDAKVAEGTPSFRFHGFVRNIEGLFGSVVLNGDKIEFRDLTIERGTSHGPPDDGRRRGRRLFELLYCEACGELLLGGQRGAPTGTQNAFEMLPSAADLEALPEKGGSEYYDKMLLEQFVVFWPRREQPELSERNYDSWDAAALDPDTGVVRIGERVPAGHIGGYVYYQTDDAIRDARGNLIGRRMAQPFCCPKCGTDYSARPRSSRSRSPVRAFRTGVSKASQIVATEIFELLHANLAKPKSIVFSDSRQDAANQALEIERLHLRDLRREILVSAAREIIEEAERNYVPQEKRDRISAELAQKKNWPELQRRSAEWGAMDNNQNIDVVRRKVRLDSLLQFGSDENAVSRVTAELVQLGVHPFDEMGHKRFNDRPWWEAFVRDGRAIRFAPQLTHADRTALALEIVQNQYELVEDVIFSNTFFALEETGLAYPSLGRGNNPGLEEMDAWLRVFAGAYRVEDNKYFDPQAARQWTTAAEVPQTNRVRRFSRAVFGPQADTELTSTLDRLRSEYGHHGGIIKVGGLYLRVARPADPFWRCPSCGRVHMHRGVGCCTRCYQRLDDDPTGAVENLWDANFLGRRIVRSHDERVPRFRVRCEELTGQTDDFADRLRRFKDIFPEQRSEIGRLASEIDMLSVTTTMEVGIDIGSLQSLYQANMPPQRFNYQQRVGRAGRRGQAFSFVITFCRGRSHDAYYFRHPESITGDPPPAPFLAIEHTPIPLRLLRKVWLRAAFALLRHECVDRGEPYPGDDLVPPDVHGEYVPTDFFYAADSLWPPRLLSALQRTTALRDKFIAASMISAEQANAVRNRADPTDLHDAIMRLLPQAPRNRMGLAQFLAERGLLPMYGMPTRVRDLYLGLVRDSDGPQAEYFWSSIDRDLEMAIFEFAPGSILVKDKRKHLAIGFTGPLLDPESRGNTNVIDLGAPVAAWFGDVAYVARCPTCGAAKHEPDRPSQALVCDDCGSEMGPNLFQQYLTPSAFRTEFREDHEMDDVGQMALRTVATVLRQGTPSDYEGIRVHRGAGAMVLHLNDGIEDEQGDSSFFNVDLVSDNRAFTRRRTTSLPEQAIDSAIVQHLPPDPRWRVEQANVGPFGLVSRKETDAIYLEIMDFDRRLALDLVARRGEMFQVSARAAAISATHLVVQKAALELDVDPDEFEALEPRLRAGRPVLQIADTLINGSGLCRRLGESRSDRLPEILHLAEEIIDDRSAWPLRDFLTAKHRDACATSCYQCVQQFQNRRYHSLLDWRLGLAYLRAMLRRDFSCGLDGEFDAYPELLGWREHAQALSEAVAAMRPGSLELGVVGGQRLPCITQTASGHPVRRYIVVHPLWRLDANVGARLIGGFGGTETRYVDTFDLERRPLRALELVLDRKPVPVSALADAKNAVA
jgi:Lhr-like helicase